MRESLNTENETFSNDDIEVLLENHGSAASGSPLYLDEDDPCLTNYLQGITWTEGISKHQVQNLSNENQKSRNLSVHNSINPGSCPICHKTIRHRSNIRRHIADMHASEQGVIRFKCQICNKTYKTKNSLSNHISLCHRNRKVINI